MRILQVGNFEPKHSSETHWRLTLESLGHEVIPVQEGPRGFRPSRTAEQILEIAAAKHPDIFMWTRTWGIAGDVPAMLRGLRDLGIPTMAYHLDLYAPIERGQRIGFSPESDPWWRADYVFSPDGDPRSAEWFRERGIRHIWARPGVYHGGCYLAEPDPAQAIDVVFVGSYGYHPEWTHRPQLIDWLRATYGPRFRLVPEPGQPAVREHALNVLYASAKVCVGDSLVPGYTHERYTSDRLYETLGRGGFLIYPRIRGVIGDELNEGEHVACYDFGDFDGLRKVIDYYLEHPEERERIRLAGHARVKASCTYRERLSEALAYVAREEGRA